MIFLATGVFTGIYNLNESNAHLFNLQIIFLSKIGMDLNWLIRQIVAMESSIVSFERVKSFLRIEK